MEDGKKRIWGLRKARLHAALAMLSEAVKAYTRVQNGVSKGPNQSGRPHLTNETERERGLGPAELPSKERKNDSQRARGTTRSQARESSIGKMRGSSNPVQRERS
jgi:hypothetical protein